MDKNTEIALLLDLYGKVLSPIQFKSIDLYYNQDLSLSEISYHTGKSRQGVYDSIKRSEAILLKIENSLGFLEKMRKITATLEEITAVASEIKNSANDETLASKAEKIEQMASGLKHKI